MKHTILALSIILSACATTYKRAGDNGTKVGYSDVKLSPGVYRVKYRGVLPKDSELVYKFFLTRAAELTVENKFELFYVEAGAAGRIDGGSMVYGHIDEGSPTYEGTVHMGNQKDGNHSWFKAVDILEVK